MLLVAFILFCFILLQMCGRAEIKLNKMDVAKTKYFVILFYMCGQHYGRMKGSFHP